MEKPYYIHESSYVDDNVSIGAGTKIWHFCHIQSGAVIGERCSLGQNVNVGNNVKIGNFGAECECGKQREDWQWGADSEQCFHL